MSCAVTKLVSRMISLAVLVLITACPGISALASTNSGIDTPTGVTTLPLGVQGVEGMDLVAQPGGSVYVGVGTTNPEAALDVSGAVRATGSTVVSGTAYATVATNPCTPPGAIAYDSTNNAPVFCNSSTNKWTPINPAVSAVWYNASGSRSANTVYQNTHGYPIQVSVTAYDTYTGTSVELYTGSSATSLIIISQNGEGAGAGSFFTAYATIPPEWYYKATWGSVTSTYWYELY